MSVLTLRWRAAAASVAALAAIAIGAAAVGARPGGTGGKQTTGTAWVSITHNAGGFQYAAGNTTDKVLGTGAITYKIKLGSGTMPSTLTITVPSVTLYTPTGSLTGTASATLVTSAATQTITNGKLKLTRGTGSQTGHSLIGTFTGTGNLTANQFVFHDKGTYK